MLFLETEFWTKCFTKMRAACFEHWGRMQVGSSHFHAKLSPLYDTTVPISHSFLTERGFESDPENGTVGRAELFWKSEASHSNGLPVKCETSTSCPSASDVPSTDCYKNVAENPNWFLHASTQIIMIRLWSEICQENGRKNWFLDDSECDPVKITHLWKGILYFPKMYPINIKQKNCFCLKPNLNISK